MKKLSKKKLAFIDAYFALKFHQTNAYLAVHPNVTEESAATLSGKLLRKVEIADEIARRQKKLDEKNIITVEELLKDLKEIKDLYKGTFPPSALKAIEIINKMLGYNASDKVDHTTNGKDIHSIQIEIIKKPDGPDKNVEV